jgi:hypothetical protein
MLEPKSFSILHIQNKPSSVTSLLLFSDPTRISSNLEQFLDQLGLVRQDVNRKVIRDNPYGVKQVLYFDNRFICIFRDQLAVGDRKSSQLVDVVDLKTQQLVFQEVSTETQIITHVKVFKISKTKETQLFVGTSNKSHEGHSRAEWKIYRVIQRKTHDNQ